MPGDGLSLGSDLALLGDSRGGCIVLSGFHPAGLSRGQKFAAAKEGEQGNEQEASGWPFSAGLDHGSGSFSRKRYRRYASNT